MGRVTSIFVYNINEKPFIILPVEPTAHTAIGVTHESQSRGVNKLLLHTAPLLFTQTSHESGSEPGYDDDEHSNNVMWCTIDFFVLEFVEIFVLIK